MAPPGRSKDSAHSHITTWTVRTPDPQDPTKTKTSTMSQCDHCGLEKVFSNIGRWKNHLSGVDEYCVNNGGIGPCERVPEPIKQKFAREIKEKLDGQARMKEQLAARERMELAARGDAPAAGAAAGAFEPPKKKGALAAAFESKCAIDADEAVANLFFGCPTIPANVAGTRY